MALVGIGIMIVLFVAFAILTWIAIIYFSKEEDEEIDAPIGLNFIAGQTDGRAVGVEKYVNEGKEGRKVITFSARDVRIKDIKQMPDVQVIVDKNKTITLPKGTWSKDKNINIYLPPSVDKFPEPLKKTEFGKILMLYTALKDADNGEIDAFKEGMKRQKAHIQAMGAGEISIKHLTQINELFQETLDSIRESKKKDENTSGFSPPRFGSNIGGN